MTGMAFWEVWQSIKNWPLQIKRSTLHCLLMYENSKLLLFYQLEEIVSAIKDKNWGVKQLMKVLRMYCMTCQNCPRRERPDLFQLILEGDTFADIVWLTCRPTRFWGTSSQLLFDLHCSSSALDFQFLKLFQCFNFVSIFFKNVFLSYISCVGI